MLAVGPATGFLMRFPRLIRAGLVVRRGTVCAAGRRFLSQLGWWTSRPGRSAADSSRGLRRSCGLERVGARARRAEPGRLLWLPELAGHGAGAAVHFGLRLVDFALPVPSTPAGGLQPLVAWGGLKIPCADWWLRGGPLVSLLPWCLEMVAGWIGPEEAEVGRDCLSIGATESFTALTTLLADTPVQWQVSRVEWNVGLGPGPVSLISLWTLYLSLV
ncbi:hypothetical protein NDU88_003761 [Pleurodeles waltl]|uniref:Uncharacterized protein n=1 Tax=Pleurodeles waltl TaxID=8319 RepID=A0AAV7L2N0_PLEWA|nr:hypothetical protein NDU88_003741 [Pleurodeles waltl]KAJ1083604.1 hypothetical protein NDU88_003761 [Pleurodeles waltl]